MPEPRGELPTPELLARREAAVSDLERATATADLSPQPDRDAVDRFLVEAYEDGWRGAL